MTVVAVPTGRVQPAVHHPAVPTRAIEDLWEIADGSNPPVSRINATIYGPSGSGKTSLVTALPWGTERWGDIAAYVAWDAGSESLLSVSPDDRKHLKIITPRAFRTPDGQLEMNPYKAGMEIAAADWATLIPGCRTLIWDGGTRFAEQILRGVANTGATVSPAKKKEGEETRLVFGEKGDPDYMALPIIPDYGMAQFAVMQWSERLRQQPLNVLVVCVNDYYKPEGGSLDGDTVGGPALVGTKIIPKFMKDFDNIFRLSIETETVAVEQKDQTGKPLPPKFERANKRYLWTEKNGIWDAKIRRPPDTPNPLARVEVTPNRRKFWEQFDASGLGVK